MIVTYSFKYTWNFGLKRHHMVTLIVNHPSLYLKISSYRKIKAEQELGRRTWLVDYHDIQIRKGRLNDSFMSKSLLTLDTKVRFTSNFQQTQRLDVLIKNDITLLYD